MLKEGVCTCLTGVHAHAHLVCMHVLQGVCMHVRIECVCTCHAKGVCMHIHDDVCIHMLKAYACPGPAGDCK